MTERSIKSAYWGWMQMKGTRFTVSLLGILVLSLGIPLSAIGQGGQRNPDQPQAADQQQPAADQSSGAADESSPMQAMSPEAELLSKMHMANGMEIKAGELAQSKGSTIQIRRFGALLARDHRTADSKISALAKQQNIKLMPPMPKSPEEKQKMEMQKQMLADLPSAQGEDFDRKFLDFNEKAYDMAINMVQMGHDQLQPSPVKTLAGKMVPILKQHKELADHLSQRQTAMK